MHSRDIYSKSWNLNTWKEITQLITKDFHNPCVSHWQNFQFLTYIINHKEGAKLELRTNLPSSHKWNLWLDMNKGVCTCEISKWFCTSQHSSIDGLTNTLDLLAQLPLPFLCIHMTFQTCTTKTRMLNIMVVLSKQVNTINFNIYFRSLWRTRSFGQPTSSLSHIQ